MSEKDGGPAFPGGLAGPEYGSHAGMPMVNGMSLRAYIATAALQALIAKVDGDITDAGFFDENIDGMIAATAAIYADALIAELAK